MKRCFALLLVLSLVVVLALPVYAADIKIAGINEAFFAGGDMQAAAEKITGEQLTDLSLYAGGKIVVRLPAALFTDNQGIEFNLATGQEYVTDAQISAGKVKLHKAFAHGSDLVESIDLVKTGNEGSPVAIVIYMQQEFVSIAERDFECNLMLSIGGKRQPATAFKVAGKMTFKKIALNADASYVNLSDGTVAEAQEYIRKIEVDLGNGITITTNMFQDKKYYGTARPSDFGDGVVNYDEIQAVYTLHTVNLKSAGNNVRIKWDGEAWVCNAEGQYIGTTDQALPYSSCYYICNNRFEGLQMSTFWDDMD